MFNRQESSNTFGNDYRSRFNSCNDFFGNKFDRHAFGRRGEFRQKIHDMFASRKAANIIEDENNFIIELYAAGLNKNNFKVSVSDDILTIAYNATEENNEIKYAHREYTPVSFERSFQLNERALTDNINATYTDGVLKVTLHKNPDTNKPAQEIIVD